MRRGDPMIRSTQTQATHRAIDAVWRIECARIIGGVARLVRDVGLAEELAQDALVAALEHWPARGVPDNPGAWLMATAKNRALDHLRRDQLLARKHEQIGQDLQAQQALVVPDFVDGLDAARADTIGDDMLRLIFTACHPVLGAEARVALTLKMVAGLSTAEIARAHLTSEATLAQRFVRAKRTLAAARVPFELPRGEALAARLASVLEVIYLIFNAGLLRPQQRPARHPLAEGVRRQTGAVDAAGRSVSADPGGPLRRTRRHCPPAGCATPRHRRRPRTGAPSRLPLHHFARLRDPRLNGHPARPHG
jgi:RNA polymerase sigma factor (sigma-70 family)